MLVNVAERLRRRGFNDLQFINVGGGLAIDYEQHVFFFLQGGPIKTTPLRCFAYDAKIQTVFVQTLCTYMCTNSRGGYRQKHFGGNSPPPNRDTEGCEW